MQGIWPRDGFNLQALDRGMTPVVLEQYGRTAPGAQAIFSETSKPGWEDPVGKNLCFDDCVAMVSSIQG